jgi:FxLD family lantipeptide
VAGPETVAGHRLGAASCATARGLPHRTCCPLRKEHVMTLTPPTAEAEATENPFGLELEVVTGSTDGAPMACITDDGCGSTCASACASRSY